MGYIGNEPTTGHFPVDNFTSSGGSTYTLAKAPASAGAIEVSVQGVLQPTTAYTVSGSTLNMAGVTTGVKIFVRHLGETLSLPTPADGSVTTSKLGTNSVDGTKIAMGSDAAGDILYHGATDYARLAKGTAGQALVMNSGATAPEWGSGLPTAGADGQVLTSDGTNWASEAVAASGGLKLLTSGTVSTVSAIDITLGSKTIVCYWKLLPSQNGYGIDLRVKTGGTLQSAANYHSMSAEGGAQTSNGTLSYTNVTNATYWPLMHVQESSQGGNGSFIFFDPANTNHNKGLTWRSVGYNTSNAGSSSTGAGIWKLATTAISHLQIYQEGGGGTLTGKYVVYEVNDWPT